MNFDNMKADTALNDQLKEVAEFLNDIEAYDKPGSEFETCINGLKRNVDSCEEYSDFSYCILPSVSELFWAVYESYAFSVFRSTNHLLLDTDAPKSICSLEWLSKVE